MWGISAASATRFAASRVSGPSVSITDRLKHLFLGSDRARVGSDDPKAATPSASGDPDGRQPADGPPDRSGTSTKRRAIIVGGAIFVLVVAFLAGFFIADDSGRVSALEEKVASVEEEASDASDDAEAVSRELEQAEEGTESLEEKLKAERSLNGKTSVPQNAEFDADFDWETAGRVGYLTMKPIAIEQQGEKWILTVEAKNEGNEPEEPFCGDAGAALEDSGERVYSGEAVLGESSDNCGDALQPGLTGTYKGEFKLPPDAEPAIAIIYGDYDQEEEAKAWALPSGE